MQRAILLVILSGLAWTAHASQWRWIGPPAGNISSVTPDPQYWNIWYAVNGQELYRSEDGAKNWIRTGISPVLTILVHPVSSRVIVVTFDNNKL